MECFPFTRILALGKFECFLLITPRVLPDEVFSSGIALGRCGCSQKFLTLAFNLHSPCVFSLVVILFTQLHEHEADNTMNHGLEFFYLKFGLPNSPRCSETPWAPSLLTWRSLLHPQNGKEAFNAQKSLHHTWSCANRILACVSFIYFSSQWEGK